MPASAPAILPFRQGRSRHREVVARLAGISACEAAFDWNDTWASSFREAADALGPVFSAFADYLGSRADLASIADCRRLSRSARPPRLWDGDRIRQLVSAEAGPGIGITAIDSRVLAVTPCSQTHAARLTTGERVRIEVITIDPDEAAADLDLLHLTRQACASRFAGAVFDTVVADFRTRFAQACDCRQPLTWPPSLYQPSGDDPVVVPAVRVELCSRRVCTTQVTDLSEFNPVQDDEVREIGVRAISWWLRRAIAGKPIPLTAGPFLDESRRLLMTGPFTQLPVDSASRLIEYLLAVAADAPDRAWRALVRDLAPTPEAGSNDEVMRSFRCLVPFRDDRTCDSGSDVADRMYLQWRVATKHGWVPAPHLTPFYQGCFRLVEVVRGQTGARDAVAEALHGLRTEAGARQFEEWSRGLDVMNVMEQQMGLLMQVPQKLDQLLTMAAEGTVRVQLVSGDAAGAARRSRLATVIAAVLVACAVSLLAATALSMPSAWSGVTQAVLLVGAGGLLVWAVGRVL